MLTRITPTAAVAYWNTTHSAQFGTPDAHPVPGREAARQQRTRHAVNFGAEFSIRVAHVLERDDQRVAVGERTDGVREIRTDRLPEQWLGVGTRGIGRGAHCASLRSGSIVHAHARGGARPFEAFGTHYVEIVVADLVDVCEHRFGVVVHRDVPARQRVAADRSRGT